MSSTAYLPPAPGPVGIGGWLVLPIIGFFGTILLTCFNLLQGLAELKGLIAIFTASASEPLSGLKIPFAASVVLGLFVIGNAVACLVLIFTKKSAIVKIATIHYLALLLAGLADLWIDAETHRILPSEPADPTVIREALRGVLIACIWIPYFHLSKRVRNTFLNKDLPAGTQPAGNPGIPR
jgi:Protein of unknown function (DUF2569)